MLKIPAEMNLFQKILAVIKCIAFAPLIVGRKMSRNALKD
jgi:hypothetical protein